MLLNMPLELKQHFSSELYKSIPVNFNIICVSETFLNFETPPNDPSLEIPDFNMYRTDHPSYTKKEVYAFCKKQRLL